MKYGSKKRRRELHNMKLLESAHPSGSMMRCLVFAMWLGPAEFRVAGNWRAHRGEERILLDIRTVVLKSFTEVSLSYRSDRLISFTFSRNGR